MGKAGMLALFADRLLLDQQILIEILTLEARNFTCSERITPTLAERSSRYLLNMLLKFVVFVLLKAAYRRWQFQPSFGFNPVEDALWETYESAVPLMEAKTWHDFLFSYEWKQFNPHL